MKYTLVLALLLVGCGTTQEVLVPTTKYAVRTAPSDMKELPTRYPSADAQITSDAEAARFVTGTETYIKLLETRITELIKFYERPVK